MSRIDAVLYTHDHADHTNGLDDLRSFNKLANDAIPIYGTLETITSLKQRFPYAFSSKTEEIWYRPSLIPHILPDLPVANTAILDLQITVFKQIHGKVSTLGYRIGDFSYSTDCNLLPETAFEALKGTEVWIVDCLRYTKSYTHSHLEMTLAWIKRVNPRLAVLTHMAHDFDYNILLNELPAGVVPGYDGMVIEL